jgi:pimeloyl-ACP methyl ester carboxylesterase
MSGSGDGFVPVAGRWLEYRHWSAPGSRAPTLVLLHEGLGSVAMWKEFPERLAQSTGCGVFAYSRAGYGRSDPATLPRTPAYMHPEGLEVLPAVLDFIGAPQVVLVGHSDGASIALIHAGGTADQRVCGLVLMAPHVFIEDICVARIAEARVAWESGDLRGRLAKYHADAEPVFRGWNDIWLDPAFRSWNIEALLPAVRAPVLVVQGEDDEYGTLAQVDAVLRGVGGPAQALILPACRHSPHRDQPAALLDGIVVFLRQYGLGA